METYSIDANMIKKIAIAFAGMMLLVISSCTNDKEELLFPPGSDCNGVNSKFVADVSPIIQSRCAVSGCHDATSTNGPGPLTTYERIRDASPRIKPAVVNRIMPKGSSLSADEIKKIVCWIDSGSPNN